MYQLVSDKQLFHITFLRHGESTGNLQGLHQGQSDFPLSDNGRRQARSLVERWRRERVRFDLIITSPLLRARQTAEIIGEALHAPIEDDPTWLERDIGKLSGMKPEEGQARYPNPDFVHPYHPIGVTGESQWGLYLRAAGAVNRLIQRSPGRYLVVTHGGILNLAIYAILGIAPQANFAGPRFTHGNAGFTTFTYNPSQHIWRMTGANDRAHLSSALANKDPLDHPLADPDQGESQAKSTLMPEGLAIRQAGSADVNVLCELFAIGEAHHRRALPEIFRAPYDANAVVEFIRTMIADPKGGVFLAEQDGKGVGFVYIIEREAPAMQIFVPRRFAVIDNVVVMPDARGQGLGGALMERAHAWARERGLAEVELNVWEFNEGAVSLYKRLGYSVISRRMSKKL